MVVDSVETSRISSSRMLVHWDRMDLLTRMTRFANFVDMRLSGVCTWYLSLAIERFEVAPGQRKMRENTSTADDIARPTQTGSRPGASTGVSCSRLRVYVHAPFVFSLTILCVR